MSKYEPNKENPFINDELVLQTKDKRVRVGLKLDDTRIADPDTGEMRQVYGHIYTKTLVDSGRFIKLYVNSMSSIFSLQKAGGKVLTYICQNLGIGQDYVDIDIKDCMFILGYTRQSVYNGLDNLLLAGIIARSNSRVRYWINPNVIFNGNRLRIINEYVSDQRKIIDIQIEEGTEEDKRIEQKFKDSNLNS